jgi:hypothetical protein
VCLASGINLEWEIKKVGSRKQDIKEKLPVNMDLKNAKKE